MTRPWTLTSSSSASRCCCRRSWRCCCREAPSGRRARLVAVADQSARRLRVVTRRVVTRRVVTLRVVTLRATTLSVDNLSVDNLSVDNLSVPLDRPAAAVRSSAPFPDRLSWLDDQYRL